MGNRRKSRELALQVLYACDFNGQWSNTEREFLFANVETESDTADYARELCTIVAENLSQIDLYITEASQNWSISRISLVDRAILRVGIAELAYFDEIPASAVINEALEISKDFGSEKSAGFINGILDSISRRLEAGEGN